MRNIRNKIHSSIKYKLSSVFLLSLLIGNCISIFAVAPYIKRKVVDGLSEKYEIIITRIDESSNSKESLYNLINLYEDIGYSIKPIDNISDLGLDINQKNILSKENKLIYISMKEHGVSAVTKVNNQYFHIKSINSKSVKYIPLSINLCILTITSSICIFILSFVLKKIIAPMEELMDATNEIAAGNFDVKVKYKNINEDEIGKLVKNFNSMAKDLKNIECIQTDFMNNVSHEFKTPISAIKGFLVILKNENLSQKERLEYIDILLDETDRLSQLSSNILECSKLDNMDKFKDNKKFSLDEQIRKTIILLEKQWSKKNISFNLDLKSTYYYGKEEYLIQVWINIISNAIKFSDENSEILISCHKTANEVFIEIKDYGCGMDENTKKYLFNKFYQGDNSRNDLGYGLGLSISYRIIELSGGTITVDSELDKYTKFTVTLPYE